MEQRLYLAKPFVEHHAMRVAAKTADLLVAENGLHSLISRLRNPAVEHHHHIQIVHLTLNQTIHSPEDGIQV